MIYREEKHDLFSVPYDFALCHCISHDYKMGAGIAVAFAQRGIKQALFELRAKSSVNISWENHGYCVLANSDHFAWLGCFNLVTKEHYWEKPTLKTLREALQDMKSVLAYLGANSETPYLKLAMPKIGCGLDGLKWCDVSELIQSEFRGTELEILVCCQ